MHMSYHNLNSQALSMKMMAMKKSGFAMEEMISALKVAVRVDRINLDSMRPCPVGSVPT
jgi:hypothetical protein